MGKFINLILESVKINCRGKRQHTYLVLESLHHVGVFCSGRGGLAELIEVDLAITVGVGQVHHLGDDIVSNVLAEAAQELGELILGDDTVLVLVEHGEGLLQFLELFSGKLGHI